MIDSLERRQLFAASYLVPTTKAQATVFDPTRNRLYVMAGSSILRFDLNTKTQLSPWTGVGTYLEGGDITTDGKSLYVADGTIAAGQSLIHKIDLATGSEKNISYAIDYDDSANQVTITSDNRALIGHSGQWGNINVLDLATDNFIDDAGTNTYGVSTYRGKDRSLVVASANGISPGETTVYDARTKQWAGGDWNSGVDSVAISPDGNEIATSNAYLDRSLKLLRTRTASTPLGYDPNGSLLYTFEPVGDPWDTPQGGTVVARDRTTDAVKFSFSVADDISGWTPALGAATDDGHWLVLTGTAGVHIYDLTAYKPTTGTGSIAGTIFKDADSNGVRGTTSAEAGLANVKVFLDKNQNGVLDSDETSVLTDGSGNYKFTGLVTASSYRVREVVPSGYGIKTPGNTYFDVPMATMSAVTGKTFANALVGSVSGSVFNDANKNLKRDVGELGLGLWTVYMDNNNNGKLDAGEATVLTDINGNWKFSNLFAGTYTFRVVAITGTAITTPTGTGAHATLTPGQNTTGKLFGMRSIS